MNITKLIARTKAELAKLETRNNAALQKLVTKSGYKSPAELIEALRGLVPAGKPLLKKKPRKARAVVTPATRKSVVRHTRIGVTAAETAKRLGLSIGTVQRIKKEAGLVKARS